MDSLEDTTSELWANSMFSLSAILNVKLKEFYDEKRKKKKTIGRVAKAKEEKEYVG